MIKTRIKDIEAEYTPEELVDAFVFPAELSKREKSEGDAVLNEVLKQRRQKMSSSTMLKGALLQLRYQIEDYLENGAFDKHKTFGHFLHAYVNSLHKKQNEFAAEINIKPTELSQYINNHRKPPQAILIRLELHSRKMIPATDWYRLIELENLHSLATDKQIRKEERKFVVKEAQYA